MSGKTWSGGCQCGAVRFRLEQIADPSFCHCRMCQKAFAGPGAALVDVEGLVWTRGAPKYFQSSNIVKRGFCADCGTQLTFEVAEGPSIAIATFDEADEIVPALQVNLDRRLPWADHIAELPRRTAEQIAARESHYASIKSYQHPDQDTDVWPAAKKPAP